MTSYLKLEHYVIRDNMLNWFKSYLSNRKQYVFLNGESSAVKEITCGVLQGSVLGPLLYYYYTLMIFRVSLKYWISIYLLMIAIYIMKGITLKKLEKMVNKELGKLQVWLNINMLSLNINKTNYVIFHPFNRIPAACSKMSNILDIAKLSKEPLKLTESFPFLACKLIKLSVF